eukprot:TRINITY_DN2501_c0_g2_i1.p1 TRINITY_DN2501_c0_g2~~TRINITY_DN2501_c0_g2_i1.p1  ORF type:complete len:570 (-),score=170.14 TRINITY_DN2501_c0_g2_i1:118-1827(-)
MQRAAVCCAVLLFVQQAAQVSGDAFLKQDPRLHRHVVDRDAEFQQAMASVMGCGGSGESQGRLAAVERVLQPIWQALPKNDHGRVEWQMMRYAAHRYFLQQSSLLIRGFEPVRRVNDTHLGTAAILEKHAPSLVETVLEGKRSSNGFTLQDVVAMVATLEQVIYDSESHLVELVYRQQRRSPGETLNALELSRLMETYMVNWMIDESEEVIDFVMRNATLLEQVLPHWQEIRKFVRGMVKSMEFARQRSPQPGHGLTMMTQRYSFQDAHEVVGSITKSFASYWESECQTIKSSLVALDRTGTGRVPLSDFYGSNSDGEWRFGESEAYLRELGALDGNQVIIPNYLLGASNCIVSTAHYFVCCVNECEGILNDIEAAVGGPVAKPEDIITPLVNLTGLDDEGPKLDSHLRTQLQRIAEIHGGQVPLHGRLFAQWLHYAFPRECPFPHKAGTASIQAPNEFGDEFMASSEAVSAYAEKRTGGNATELEEQEAAQWMSQWSEEEELIADYSSQLRAPWERSRFALSGFAGLTAAGLMVCMAMVSSGVGRPQQSGGGKAMSASVFDNHKAHYV